MSFDVATKKVSTAEIAARVQGSIRGLSGDKKLILMISSFSGIIKGQSDTP
mgnify:CR=1 FL=1